METDMDEGLNENGLTQPSSDGQFEGMVVLHLLFNAVLRGRRK
jgi:hypothetical protein